MDRKEELLKVIEHDSAFHSSTYNGGIAYLGKIYNNGGITRLYAR